jgi:hypothetical protein
LEWRRPNNIVDWIDILARASALSQTIFIT